MNRVQLFYKDLSEIAGSNGFSIVRLTDAGERNVLCVICDKAMSEQLTIRFHRLPFHQQMLPEVLLQMLESDGKADLELMVYDIIDGQYRVSLLNKRSLTLKPIRMSDAVLLHYISRIPLYIEEGLMRRQCSPYNAESCNISVPINTLDTEHLTRELKRAIDEEDYRLASHLHEELQKRNKQ